MLTYLLKSSKSWLESADSSNEKSGNAFLNGTLEFKDVVFKYRPELDPVFKGSFI